MGLKLDGWVLSKIHTPPPIANKAWSGPLLPVPRRCDIYHLASWHIQVCMERHLELAHTLSDETAAVQANEQLGLLAVEKGEWNEAAKLLTQAMDLSSRQNDQRMLWTPAGVIFRPLWVSDRTADCAFRSAPLVRRPRRWYSSFVSQPPPPHHSKILTYLK